MSLGVEVPLGRLLLRAPRYGVNAAAVPLKPGVAPYIRITDISENGRFAPNPKVGVAHRDIANYRMSPGELVFARTGASVGKSYLYNPADGDLVYAGFLINIAPDPKRLDPRFLALYVQTREYWNWVARTSVRSGQPGINGKEYATLLVPVPDILVQNAIANAIRDIDDLIAALERLITKKNALKQGMMQQLLTGRTRLPGFERAWREVSLGSVATVTMGQSPVGSSYNSGGRGLPLIQGNADIKNRVTIDRIWTTAPTKTCEADDVLLTVRAPVGYTAIASKASCLGRGVCALNAKSDNRFLFHALVYAEPTWGLYEQGSTFTAVNSNEVRSFSLAWPSDAEERAAIASLLDDVDRELLLLDVRRTKAQDVKTGMLQQLLTGRTHLPAEGAS